MAGDGGSHDADRSCSGDQNVLSHQIKAECGVDRIAQWVEDSADVVADFVRQGHHVKGRKCEIFGKGPRFIDADTAGFGVEMELTGA